jgi:hypothetical protein
MDHEIGQSKLYGPKDDGTYLVKFRTPEGE